MISTRLRNLLEQNGIAFEVVPHDPAFTAQHLAARLHVPGREFVKAVVVRLDGQYAIAAVPAHRLVDNKALARAAGAARCALATEAEFRELFPDCEVGAMPPVGNLYGLPTFVDEEVTRDETIVANAGTHAEAIRLRYRDLARVVRPTVGRFAVPPPSESAPRTPAPKKGRPARAKRRKRGTAAKAGSRRKAARRKAPGKKAGGKKRTPARTTAASRKKAPSRRRAAARKKTTGRPRTTRKKGARKTVGKKTAVRKSRHR